LGFNLKLYKNVFYKVVTGDRFKHLALAKAKAKGWSLLFVYF